MSAKTLTKLILVVAAIAFPWYPFIKYSQVVNADLACEYALIAFSTFGTSWSMSGSFCPDSQSAVSFRTL